MKLRTDWYSTHLQQTITIVRWGDSGTPVLLFPTAGGDAEECERFLMVKVLAPLIEGGRIKLYSCDSVAGSAWTSRAGTGRHRSWVQNQFDKFVADELVGAIRQDCGSPDIEIITAGASIGAFNAVASLCRHPDIFKAAIGLSGTYDLTRWLDDDWNEDFYFSSPLHYLPGLGDSEQLAQLRQRFVLLATGEGQWEAPAETWQMAEVLGAKGIPNRVDPWGPDYDHNWPTWREMLPQYLEELTSG
ncbi:MAG: alpha/beta hydrolase-fold protein [Acidobacteria bacterium]|nr:alpha/beta hydrolase-fold protein [Acidobacteriota bacterium]